MTILLCLFINFSVWSMMYQSDLWDVVNRSNVSFTPNAKFILASTLDSTVRLWDYQADKTLKTYTGHVNRKCVLPLDATPQYGQSLMIMMTFRYCIPSALTSTGQYLIAGSEDNKLMIWDLQTREIVQAAEGQKGSFALLHDLYWANPRWYVTSDVIIAIASHPLRNIIATGGLEKVSHRSNSSRNVNN